MIRGIIGISNYIIINTNWIYHHFSCHNTELKGYRLTLNVFKDWIHSQLHPQIIISTMAWFFFYRRSLTISVKVGRRMPCRYMLKEFTYHSGNLGNPINFITIRVQLDIITHTADVIFAIAVRKVYNSVTASFYLAQDDLLLFFYFHRF